MKHQARDGFGRNVVRGGVALLGLLVGCADREETGSVAQEVGAPFIASNITYAPAPGLTATNVQAGVDSVAAVAFANRAALTSEVAARAAGDATLAASLEAGDATLAASLASEVGARTSADASLQSDLASEVAARTTAVGVVATGVASEAAARAAADTGLASDLATELAQRMASVESEASARSTADSTLASSISTEATARANAITNVTTSISNLTGVAAQKVAAVSATAPLASSGGTNPTISLPACADGQVLKSQGGAWACAAAAATSSGGFVRRVSPYSCFVDPQLDSDRDMQPRTGPSEGLGPRGIHSARLFCPIPSDSALEYGDIEKIVVRGHVGARCQGGNCPSYVGLTVCLSWDQANGAGYRGNCGITHYIQLRGADFAEELTRNYANIEYSPLFPLFSLPDSGYPYLIVELPVPDSTGDASTLRGFTIHGPAE